MAAPLRIGTSGFAYSDWHGTFYPWGIRPEEQLAQYAARLPAVELGATFHRVPSVAHAAEWAATVPEDFRFCPSAPRALTRDLREAVHRPALAGFRDVVQALGATAGPVLVQVTSGIDPKELGAFLEALAPLRAAVELRPGMSASDALLRTLSAHEAALVVSDDVLGRPRVQVTSDFTYWRLARVADEAEWDAWAEQAAHLAARGVEVFAFVRQSRGGQAALRAERLARRVEAFAYRQAQSETSPALDGPVTLH